MQHLLCHQSTNQPIVVFKISPLTSSEKLYFHLLCAECCRARGIATKFKTLLSDIDSLLARVFACSSCCCCCCFLSPSLCRVVSVAAAVAVCGNMHAVVVSYKNGKGGNPTHFSFGLGHKSDAVVLVAGCWQTTRSCSKFSVEFECTYVCVCVYVCVSLVALTRT